jgi:putative NADH-flavin reductase
MAGPRKRSTSRKTGRTRPKRAAKRAKPTSRAAGRRPARSSKPQRKPKAAVRRTKPARKAARRSAKSVNRKAAKRPAAAPAPRKAAAKGAMPPPRKDGLRIAVFGAGGTIGSRIAREALSRGHRVTAVQRNAGGLDLDGTHVLTVKGDATDPASVAKHAKGHDAVVSAISPAGEVAQLPKAAHALLAGVRHAGVKRLVVVGGAGSLEVSPGLQLMDTPQFPKDWRPTAQAHGEALHVYRNEGTGVDWTFVSPPAMVAPGKRTGKYQVGHNHVLHDGTGKSQISAEDYAVAIVDELERGENKGRRMTVSWP